MKGKMEQDQKYVEMQKTHLQQMRGEKKRLEEEIRSNLKLKLTRNRKEIFRRE